VQGVSKCASQELLHLRPGPTPSRETWAVSAIRPLAIPYKPLPLFLQLCCADLLAATSTNTERSDADHLSSPLRLGDTIAIIPTARAISPDELSAGIALAGSGGLPVKIGSGVGRTYRTFSVFNGPDREVLNITIEASLPTERVIR